MGYVEKNLRPDERVIATAHISYWSIVLVILRTLLVVGAVIGVVTGLAQSIPQDPGGAVPYEGAPFFEAFVGQLEANLMTVAVLLSVILVLVAVFEIIRILCIRMVVTDKKIIGKYGIIYVHALDAYLEKIDSFTIDETLLGRIFGYSTIRISTASDHMKFRYISNAKKFKNTVTECYDRRLETLMKKQAQLFAAAVPARAAQAAVPGDAYARYGVPARPVYTPPVNRPAYTDPQGDGRPVQGTRPVPPERPEGN